MSSTYKPISKEDKKSIVVAFNNGEKLSYIAFKYKVSERRIKDIICREQCNKEYTDEEIIKIMELHNSGKTPTEISKEIPGKLSWMIRNKIKSLLKNKYKNTKDPPIVNEDDKTITVFQEDENQVEFVLEKCEYA